MLGFTARALDPEAVRSSTATRSPTARWFTRDELRAAVGVGRGAAPAGVSIARRLVEHWYGGALRRPGAAGEPAESPSGARARRSCTWSDAGVGQREPSGNTRVGTVWLPSLTAMTKSAASGCSSMSTTSTKSMPSRSSWPLSRMAVAAPRGAVHRQRGHRCVGTSVGRSSSRTPVQRGPRERSFPAGWVEPPRRAVDRVTAVGRHRQDGSDAARTTPTPCSPRSTPSSARSPLALQRAGVRARRRRHRQDPGDHPPHRLRRPRGRLHAAARCWR